MPIAGCAKPNDLEPEGSRRQAQRGVVRRQRERLIGAVAPDQGGRQMDCIPMSSRCTASSGDNGP